jgi:Ca2+-binding EF-hand superfamily protein
MKLLPFFLLALSIAYGQDGFQGRDGGGRGPGRGGFPNPLVTALDTDHDGIISASEIHNAPAALRTLDKNGDGQLTEDELRPQRPEGFGREGEGRRGEGRENSGPEAGSPDDMVATLMAFDKNKDGKLSKSELPERMQGLFDRGDLNHDGFLTPDEIRKLTAQAPTESDDRGGGRGEGRGEGRSEGRGFRPPDPVMMALDTNHDGIISASEIKNAAASLKTLDKNSDGQLTEDEYRPNFGRGGPGRGMGRGNEPAQ